MNIGQTAASVLKQEGKFGSVQTAPISLDPIHQVILKGFPIAVLELDLKIWDS